MKLKKKTSVRLFIQLVILVISYTSCKIMKSQSLDFGLLTQEKVVYGFESENSDTSLLIKRTDTNLVILSFYEVFEDSVIIYVNKKERFKNFLSTKNNPSYSSGYSGFKLGILLEEGVSNTIYLELKNQKKYASIVVDKSYPLCTIQRYNNIWYVNFRRKIMINR